MMIEKLRRQVRCHGGYNWLTDNPETNYGIRDVSMLFSVTGQHGAVAWHLMTHWYPESARNHMKVNHERCRDRSLATFVDPFREVALVDITNKGFKDIAASPEALVAFAKQIVETTTQLVRNVIEKELIVPTPYKPMAADLGYHATFPQYEGQQPMDRHCDLLEGKPCFYDGTSLGARELEEGFLNGGDEWLWPRLEAIYHNKFNGGEYPDLSPILQPHPREEVL